MTGKFQSFVGKQRSSDNVIATSDMAKLSAIFDRAALPERVPPAWHWALADIVTEARLGEDGHPLRGDFLPPISAPRRMFAGAAMSFHEPIQPAVPLCLDEKIVSIVEKTGATGPLTFVEVDRAISQYDRLCVSERQTFVYRAPPSTVPAAPSIPPARRQADWRIAFQPGPVQLFRFSAATFNSHRIHYDRPYAVDVEGYPGLVVQGPFIALSLLEAFYRAHGQAPIASFEFRAVQPLFDGAPFFACGTLKADEAELWAETEGGIIAMMAQLRLKG